MNHPAVRSIYFDYNATTPLDPAVREAMLPFLDSVYGNPASVHHVGRRARVALDDARERVARVLGCQPGELVFTSGGTESNNLAVFGAARLRRDRGRHLITSPVEHHAVLRCFEYLTRNEGFQATYLPVDADGRVSPDDLRAALRPDTTLVSVMAANNETGTLQPVAELGAVCRRHGVLFHTDAAQWFGKEEVHGIGQFNADLVSLCAHKFHGPKGSGALFIRSPVQPHPLLFGGSHELERRAGTENLAAIAGLAEAAERFIRRPAFPKERLTALTRDLVSSLGRLDGVQLRGSASARLSNTVSFTVSGCDSIALLAGLDLEGICASSGSACSSGSLSTSHVLLAMGVPPALARSFVRFSLGRDSTEEEAHFVASTLPLVVARARGPDMAPRSHAPR